MKLSALLAPLIASKASHATIMDVVLAFEAEQAATVDEGKEKARERWRRWKAKQPETNVGKRLPTLANDSRAGVTRVEDITSNLEITGKKEENKKEAAPLSDLQAFRAELSELDPERLEAIVKHRRLKKGQITALSARLFVKDAAACGMSISEAVDACISRGWLTVKTEYFAGRRSSQAPPKRDTYVDAMNRILEGRANGTENVFGIDCDAQRISADGQRQGTNVADIRGGLARRIIQGSG